MKVFLDDLRSPPDQTRIVARTPCSAITLLESKEVEVISFDHDLGYEGETELTGYQVLLWIEEAVALRDFRPPQMLVHNANPPGKIHDSTLTILAVRDRCRAALLRAIWRVERRGSTVKPNI